MRNTFIALWVLLVLSLAGCGQNDIITQDSSIQEAPTSTEVTATFYPLDATATAMALASAEPTSVNDDPTATFYPADATTTAQRSTTVAAHESSATPDPGDAAPIQTAETNGTPTPAAIVSATMASSATPAAATGTATAQATATATPQAATPPSDAGALRPLPNPPWPAGAREIWLPEGRGRDQAEEEILELPATKDAPARRIHIPLAPHDYAALPYEISVEVQDQTGWRKAGRLVLSKDITSSWLLSPVAVEPSRLWLLHRGGSGPTTCITLLSLDGPTLKQHYTRCDRYIDAEIYDLDGDGTGELIIPHLPFAGAGNFPTSLNITAYAWNAETAQLEPFVLEPLRGLEPERQRQLNRAIELAQGGFWKDAQALVETSTAPQPHEALALRAANLIRLNAQQRKQRIQLATTDPGFNAGPPQIFFANLDYGDYAAALDVLRSYRTAEIFSGSDGPIGNWDAAYLSRYTTRMLAAWPELGAANYLHGVALALGGESSGKVAKRLRRAVQLAPDEPLFQQALAYWERRAR